MEFLDYQLICGDVPQQYCFLIHELLKGLFLPLFDPLISIISHCLTSFSIQISVSFIKSVTKYCMIFAAI